MWPAFFIRVRPASTKAKPACMNMTSIAATTTQTVFTAIRRSALFIWSSTPSRLAPVLLCATVSSGEVQTRPSPAGFPLRAASAIASTTASAATVLDDEDEERLGEEARLEDPAAVLVRDAPLAAVADRLEDGHTDMTGLRLDRVDDRLDALPDDHRLDLDHSPSSLSPQKKPRGLMPPRRPRLPAPPSSTARTRP